MRVERVNMIFLDYFLAHVSAQYRCVVTVKEDNSGSYVENG